VHRSPLECANHRSDIDVVRCAHDRFAAKFEQNVSLALLVESLVVRNL